jgi:oxygen-independent coproporphyrinogen-3 oxidase
MVDAILVEAEARAARLPRTVFFGGGTPSLLGPRELRRLFAALDGITGFRAAAGEITVECNPESLDEDTAGALRELGVRRLSIGLQSLRPATLELFGRVHGVAQGFEAYRTARRAGFAELSVDLIYAAPGETPATWEEDLTRVLDELAPEHLSAYNLTFEPGTRFHAWLAEGRLARHSEDVELAFFRTTRHVARHAGLHAYEISNFASAGRECAHNVNYWRNGEYVGIGPSAVSKVGATRLGNVRAIEPYRKRIADGGAEAAAAWWETPGAHARLAETWWLGLRLAAGVEPDEARRTAGFPAGDADPCESVAARLAERDLLVRRGRAYALSEQGLPLADAVAREFLATVPRV